MIAHGTHADDVDATISEPAASSCNSLHHPPRWSTQQTRMEVGSIHELVGGRCRSKPLHTHMVTIFAKYVREGSTRSFEDLIKTNKRKTYDGWEDVSVHDAHSPLPIHELEAVVRNKILLPTLLRISWVRSSQDEVAAGKYENGRDESRFVRNRIPFFPVCFRFFRDKRKRDRKRDGVNGNGTKNGRAFVRPYLRYPVFNRDIPFFVPFFFNTGWACWACFFRDVGPVGP
jgi:hypothetical protein